MEAILARRSVSITELKRSPSAVIEEAGSEAVAVLNHNRPAAYLVPAAVFESMLIQLDAGLSAEIAKGIESGPGVAADAVFAELEARYAETEPIPAKQARRGAQ